MRDGAPAALFKDLLDIHKVFKIPSSLLTNITEMPMNGGVHMILIGCHCGSSSKSKKHFPTADGRAEPNSCTRKYQHPDKICGRWSRARKNAGFRGLVFGQNFWGTKIFSLPGHIMFDVLAVRLTAQQDQQSFGGGVPFPRYNTDIPQCLVNATSCAGACGI